MTTSDQPTANDTTHAIIFDLKALTRFDAATPTVTILADTGAAQVVLLAMRNGQSAQGIETPSQLIAQCLRGRATLQIGPATQALRAGLVALVEASTPHSIIATTDCVVLLTLTPSPEQRPIHHLFVDAVPLVMRNDA